MQKFDCSIVVKCQSNRLKSQKSAYYAFRGRLFSYNTLFKKQQKATLLEREKKKVFGKWDFFFNIGKKETDGPLKHILEHLLAEDAQGEHHHFSVEFQGPHYGSNWKNKRQDVRPFDCL